MPHYTRAATPGNSRAGVPLAGFRAERAPALPTEQLEPFAKSPIGNDIEAAKVMCCKLRIHHKKHKRHKTRFLISSPADQMVPFVPFVAIELGTINGISVT